MSKQHTITRKGTVINTGECGLDGENLIGYELSVTVDQLTLDRDGFLIDHDELHAIIHTSLKLGKSCEIAVKNAIEQLEYHFLEVTHIAGRMRLRKIELSVGLKGGNACVKTISKYNT